MKILTKCSSIFLFSVCAAALSLTPQANAALKGTAGQTGNCQRVGAVWTYDWGEGMPAVASGVEYVPMWWGYYGANQTVDTSSAQSLKNAGAKNLLSFNEPDNSSQANLTTAYAVQGYTLEAIACSTVGLGSISPACADDTDAWMSQFMGEVKSQGLFCSAVAIHNYNSSASGFLSYVDEVHSLYGYNVWITEFAPTDWATPTSVSVRQVCDFINTALPGLASRSYVSRYSWYCGTSPGSGCLQTAALFENDGSLTPAGACYQNPNAVSSPLANGTYAFINANSGECMEVAGGSTSPSANVDQNTYAATSGQEWTLTQLGNGVYEIINVGSGLSLDVFDQSMASGANVDQYSYWGGDCQKWFIETNSNGYYTVFEMNGGNALEVAGAATTNYANVDVALYSAATSQQWLIQDLPPGTPTGLKATAGTKQVALTWTAGKNATSYNVYRGTALGKESTTAIATGITSTSYTNTGLTTGATYYYKVAAVSSKSTSPKSNEASATSK